MGAATVSPGSCSGREDALKPIVKWPGGKSRELRRIRPLVPVHELYVEPFVGGGALFFDLEPGVARLNDASADLVDFYRAVAAADPGFRDVVGRMDRDRERLRVRAEREGPDFAALVTRGRLGTEGLDREPLVRAAAASELEIPAGGEIGRCVADKVRRLLRLEQKHRKTFAPEELLPHYETALQAGYYTAVRDRFEGRTRAEEIGRFFFLREFCYGSMFRYGKNGRFNIPYGGISYNRIRLAKKAARILSDEVRELLGRTELSTGDFEAHLESVRGLLGQKSFVFLDPPYDTEFSGYANRAFGREDQVRLARVFADLPGPALLVIQRTDFIAKLYEEVGRRRRAEGRPFFSLSYGKTYGYNVRGRNDRSATHLLVGNYLPPSRTKTVSPPRSRT